MSFVHVSLGLLFPTLLAVYSYHPPCQRGRDNVNGSAAGGTAAGTQGGHPRRTYTAALRQLASRADRRIHRMLCGQCGPGLRALACYCVVCSAWLLTKLSAGL